MPIPGPNVYAVDYYCSNPDNLISGEEHTITAANNASYHYIIPQFAPYYPESLIVQHRPNGSNSYTRLMPGTHYNTALPYIGLTLASKKNVYGAISFVDLQLEGTILITYQTVGGNYTLDLNQLTEIVANIVYNPRITSWDSISNAPSTFPPMLHTWTPADMVGEGDILQVLSDIRDALLAPTSQTLQTHLSDINNPHKLTKFQIGLPLVQNMGPATIAQAIAGVSNEVLITPVGLKSALTQLDSRQYVSVTEALSRQPVSKIVTFDVLLEFMRAYGNMSNVDPVELSATAPLILYPVLNGVYVGDQPLRCSSYTNMATGAVIRTQAVSGTNTIVVPSGVNSVKIAGRGSLGNTTVTGGSMNLTNISVNPVAFETNATITETTANITGDEGVINVRVVSTVYGFDKIISLNLASSSSSQRVYTNSFIIRTNPNGSVEFGSVTLIYTGVAPSVTNTPGADAVVTLLGSNHIFKGSSNSNTLPDSRTVEVMLDVTNSAVISYNCPVGTDITLSWYEPATTSSIIQTDCVWEIATTRTFNNSTIVDGTHLGKGTGFTLNSWKPTRDVLISNNTYFARSRWKFSDGSLSDWSEVVEFVFQAISIYPAKDTVITYFCRDYNQWATLADGYGGSSSKLIKTNAIECGYNIDGNTSNLLVSITGDGAVTIAKSEMNLVQNGGAYPYQIVVPVKLGLSEFIENIEDDRIRMYLNDDFYSSYLAHKTQFGATGINNFRVPFTIYKSGANNDIQVELVQNMSPTQLGKINIEPFTYYVKVSLNSAGINTNYNASVNKTDILVGIDNTRVFKDSTGIAFANQNLVAVEFRKLVANMTHRVLVQYAT